MNKQHSEFATAHTDALRRKKQGVDWSDVADAYDAALTHVLSLSSQRLRKLNGYMRALHALNHWQSEQEQINEQQPTEL